MSIENRVKIQSLYTIDRLGLEDSPSYEEYCRKNAIYEISKFLEPFLYEEIWYYIILDGDRIEYSLLSDLKRYCEKKLVSFYLIKKEVRLTLELEKKK